MTIGTSRALVGGIAILAVALGGFWYYSKQKDSLSSIISFDLCKAAGYQIVAGNGETTQDSCSTPDGRVFLANAVLTPKPTQATTTTSMEKMIRIDNIAPNQIITSPLTVTGQAVGNWYFEASFPVELLDGNGKSILIEPATAKSDWMTTNFVPFSITLSFSMPKTATGTLVFRNDNPSGLPENQKELRIPVRFVK